MSNWTSEEVAAFLALQDFKPSVSDTTLEQYFPKGIDGIMLTKIIDEWKHKSPDSEIIKKVVQAWNGIILKGIRARSYLEKGLREKVLEKSKADSDVLPLHIWQIPSSCVNDSISLPEYNDDFEENDVVVVNDTSIPLTVTLTENDDISSEDSILVNLMSTNDKIKDFAKSPGLDDQICSIREQLIEQMHASDATSDRMTLLQERIEECMAHMENANSIIEELTLQLEVAREEKTYYSDQCDELKQATSTIDKLNECILSLHSKKETLQSESDIDPQTQAVIDSIIAKKSQTLTTDMATNIVDTEKKISMENTSDGTVQNEDPRCCATVLSSLETIHAQTQTVDLSDPHENPHLQEEVSRLLQCLNDLEVQLLTVKDERDMYKRLFDDLKGKDDLHPFQKLEEYNGHALQLQRLEKQHQRQEELKELESEHVEEGDMEYRQALFEDEYQESLQLEGREQHLQNKELKSEHVEGDDIWEYRQAFYEDVGYDEEIDDLDRVNPQQQQQQQQQQQDDQLEKHDEYQYVDGRDYIANKHANVVVDSCDDKRSEDNQISLDSNPEIPRETLVDNLEKIHSFPPKRSQDLLLKSGENLDEDEPLVENSALDELSLDPNVSSVYSGAYSGAMTSLSMGRDMLRDWSQYEGPDLDDVTDELSAKRPLARTMGTAIENDEHEDANDRSNADSMNRNSFHQENKIFVEIENIIDDNVESFILNDEDDDDSNLAAIASFREEYHAGRLKVIGNRMNQNNHSRNSYDEKNIDYRRHNNDDDNYVDNNNINSHDRHDSTSWKDDADIFLSNNIIENHTNYQLDPNNQLPIDDINRLLTTIYQERQDKEQAEREVAGLKAQIQHITALYNSQIEEMRQQMHAEMMTTDSNFLQLQTLERDNKILLADRDAIAFKLNEANKAIRELSIANHRMIKTVGGNGNVGGSDYEVEISRGGCGLDSNIGQWFTLDNASIYENEPQQQGIHHRQQGGEHQNQKHVFIRSDGDNRTTYERPVTSLNKRPHRKNRENSKATARSSNDERDRSNQSNNSLGPETDVDVNNGPYPQSDSDSDTEATYDQVKTNPLTIKPQKLQDNYNLFNDGGDDDDVILTGRSGGSNSTKPLYAVRKPFRRNDKRSVRTVPIGIEIVPKTVVMSSQSKSPRQQFTHYSTFTSLSPSQRKRLQQRTAENRQEQIKTQNFKNREIEEIFNMVKTTMPHDEDDPKSCENYDLGVMIRAAIAISPHNTSKNMWDMGTDPITIDSQLVGRNTPNKEKMENIVEKISNHPNRIFQPSQSYTGPFKTASENLSFRPFSAGNASKKSAEGPLFQQPEMILVFDSNKILRKDRSLLAENEILMSANKAVRSRSGSSSPISKVVRTYSSPPPHPALSTKVEVSASTTHTSIPSFSNKKGSNRILRPGRSLVSGDGLMASSLNDFNGDGTNIDNNTDTGVVNRDIHTVSGQKRNEIASNSLPMDRDRKIFMSMNRDVERKEIEQSRPQIITGSRSGANGFNFGVVHTDFIKERKSMSKASRPGRKNNKNNFELLADIEAFIERQPVVRDNGNDRPVSSINNALNNFFNSRKSVNPSQMVSGSTTGNAGVRSDSFGAGGSTGLSKGRRDTRPVTASSFARRKAEKNESQRGEQLLFAPTPPLLVPGHFSRFVQ